MGRLGGAHAEGEHPAERAELDSSVQGVEEEHTGQSWQAAEPQRLTAVPRGISKPEVAISSSLAAVPRKCERNIQARLD